MIPRIPETTNLSHTGPGSNSPHHLNTKHLMTPKSTMKLPPHVRRIVIGFAGYREELMQLKKFHAVMMERYMSQWQAEEDIPHRSIYDVDMIEIDYLRLQAIADLHSPFMYKCICMADIETGEDVRSKIDNDWLNFGLEFRDRRDYPCVAGATIAYSHNFPDSNIGFDDFGG